VTSSLAEPGDIIIVLQEKKHELFRHEGNDLFVELDLPLIEALTGFSFTLKHLDKRELLLKSSPGEIITPGEVKVIPNEGMPIHKRPFEKGRLFVRFNVVFPVGGSISSAAATQLEKLLPGRRPAVVETEHMEAVDMVTLDAAQAQAHQEHGRGHRDSATEGSDEEEGSHPRGVQCAQQ